jgi:hypothetical protein
VDTVGRCTLTPPDPQLKGAWFQPLPLNINPGFKMCLSKCNLRHYNKVGGVEILPGMVESQAALAVREVGGGVHTTYKSS